MSARRAAAKHAGMDFITVDRRGQVTTITLNRPQAMNSITPDMHHQLQAAFDGFAADPE